jgi:hypothetical protein
MMLLNLMVHVSPLKITEIILNRFLYVYSLSKFKKAKHKNKQEINGWKILYSSEKIVSLSLNMLILMMQLFRRKKPRLNKKQDMNKFKE